MSRINLKMKSDEETEINAQGPKISDEAYDELLQKLDKADHRCLVIDPEFSALLVHDGADR